MTIAVCSLYVLQAYKEWLNRVYILETYINSLGRYFLRDIILDLPLKTPFLKQILRSNISCSLYLFFLFFSNICRRLYFYFHILKARCRGIHGLREGFCW